MRPPRYRFPDEVRSTARAMASRMVKEGTLPETDEELEAWIAARPDVREPLERGGYGPKFGANDLLPLIHVFAGAAGGAAPRTADVPAKAGPGRWIALAAVVVLAIVLAVLLVGCAPPRHAVAGADPAVTVRYEHLRTCTRFMGQDGRYLVYRVVAVDNGGSAAFTLQPSLLRFPDGSAPALAVPEFSDREAAPGERTAYDESYLLRMAGDAPTPRGAVPLAYADPAVALVRAGAGPAQDEPDACDAYTT
jgi:hypothetical protein